jgi:phosphate transport system substrate-binding protein
MHTRHARFAAALLAVTSVVAACGGDDDGSGSSGGGLAGDISIDGSSTVAPLSEAIAEEFRAEAPEVQVSVGTAGTGGGFKKFCAGEIDIADASRAIKEEEIAACKAAGVAYTELRVGLDGLAIVTSSKNDFLECLTLDQLATIFEDGGARTWDEVDPKFPKEDIAIFAPGTDSGTYDFFVEETLGESRKPRTDYTASEDDNTLVQGVAGEASSWGYFGFAYFKENEAILKDIEVAGDDGTCVAPNDETVESGEYPLSRPLSLYVNDEALGRPEVRAFLEFYLETTPELISEVGYTPAPAADYEKGLDALAGSD